MTDVRAYYEDYWTDVEDVSAGDCTTEARRRRLLATLRRYTPAGAPVLDLGCGAGPFTHWIANSGYEAVGVDVSATAIARARDHYKGARFELLGEGGRIPLDDEAVAAVWTSEVIEHVLDVPAFLCEIHRVLRPKGILVLTTPYHGVAKNVLLALTKFAGHFNPLGSHIRFFDRPGLRTCLRRAGFAPLHWGAIGCCWPLYRTWFVVARRIGEDR